LQQAESNLHKTGQAWTSRSKNKLQYVEGKPYQMWKLLSVVFLSTHFILTLVLV